MMCLEDVAIEGFKSFAQQTDMSFQPGIGVIIGNNGVGKSNILDAIVWALGEDDLARVRCYQREELFFAGSKDHPPSPRIRVELNFKESERQGAPVLRIVRELDRSGETRFQVQDEMMGIEAFRRRLAELDLADALKTIIRQEQINDLLQLDPPGRLQALGRFLGGAADGELAAKLCGPVDALFQRYFSYLMPLAEVKLQLPEHNGMPGFEIEIDLPGNRFHNKKNLLNQFLKSYQYTYVDFGPKLIEQAMAMQEDWCTWRDCESSELLAAENRAILRVLDHWNRFESIMGGALFVENLIVGYTLAEPLTADTLVIHFEKGCPAYKGGYQAINQMFLAHAGAGFRLVNREQDLDSEGLRKAKVTFSG
jgi:hypothetical protein